MLTFLRGSAARRQQERRIDRKSGLWALSGDCKRAQRAAVEAGVENKDQDESTTALTGLVFWVKPARILQRSRNRPAKPLWRSYRSIDQHKHTQHTAQVRVKEEQSKRKPSSLRVPPQNKKCLPWFPMTSGTERTAGRFQGHKMKRKLFFHVGRWIFCVSFHEKVSPLSNVALSPVHPTGSKRLFKKYCTCVHSGKIWKDVLHLKRARSLKCLTKRRILLFISFSYCLIRFFCFTQTFHIFRLISP